MAGYAIYDSGHALSMPPMTRPETELEHDWLGACRNAARGVKALLDAAPTSAERVIEVGTTGEGGDQTLVIDAEAEQCVFDELDRLHDLGARFTAVSEERGVVDYGSADLKIVIDPIDGSLNAKRGISHHALSIAVARGSTMADVVLGFVHDFGPEEEWRAELGGGAFLNDAKVVAGAERRDKDGRLELVAIESAWPRLMKAAADDLEKKVYRVRAMGTIACSMCQVAAGRADGMASLAGCRAVDAAAAQLIVRESGGLVAFPNGDADPLAAPLDLVPHGPVLAARTAQGLTDVATLPVV
jgi:myo-inositol-1(or 4)-monophosphatase